MKFRVHTALHEETNNGWIWATYPQLQARSVVQITNLATKRSVHCEYREIDKFFLKRFNQSKPDATNQMTLEENPIAISLWYRNALGIQGIGMDVDLELNSEKISKIRKKSDKLEKRRNVRVCELKLITALQGLQSVKQIDDNSCITIKTTSLVEQKRAQASHALFE